VGGVVTAYVFYLKAPSIPAAFDRALKPVRTVLENKYYMDWFNENVLAAAARMLGTGLWKGGDQAVIDGVVINGSARVVGAFAGIVRLVQTGHLYWYALVMVLGIFGFLTWRLWPFLGA
jgi:NADH-quinone oxidoreductase subunit L